MVERRDLRPVQVFLDTKKFIESQEVRPPRGRHDFYAGNDRGFAAQKDKIRKRLRSISSAMKERHEPAAFMRVQMREDALAKSYRPLGTLFTEAHGFAFVGTERIGEILFQVTPRALDDLESIIEEKAELTVRMAPNRKTGKLEPRVSGYRSEVGGISEISLYDSNDRVSFTAEEAVEWLGQPGIVGGYVVELFRPQPQLAPSALRSLIAGLETALSELPFGVITRSFLPSETLPEHGEPMLAISVQLPKEKAGKEIVLPFNEAGAGLVSSTTSVGATHSERNLDIESHRQFLEALSAQALVRHIDLPPLMEAAPAGYASGNSRPTLVSPSPQQRYPVVGIIDGGIADIPELAAWCVGDAGLVPVIDRDETHGTFIAGLVVAGSHLNPDISKALEASGCKFFDIDIFPRRELRNSYYGQDADFFFDLLDEKIKAAKRDFSVRVFNFSFGISRYASRSGYTAWADRLDRIARANDIILVISAGNLAPASCRPAWPKDATAAVTMLAGFGANDQQISPPSEHLLGITVGAINPPGIRGHETGLPTTYTRRGPGVGGARKPDLAHYGGAGVGRGNRTGLISLSPAGEATENCGTSFAAPNVAATVATLDHRLEHSQSRELLLALPVHRASRGKELSHRTLRHISRDFVGFGQPPVTDELLSDEPYAITLVFNERLPRRKILQFPFSWPSALVSEVGACSGRIDLTLAYTSPIDAAHKDEALRAQLEAHLFQEEVDPISGDIQWASQLTQDGSGVPQGMNKTEQYLLKTGLKWSPIKRYTANMPRGRGSSSNWKLVIDAQTRAGASLPVEGVSFCLIMTISDPKEIHPIHDAIRNELRSQGHVLADIMVSHRIRPSPV
ncbi:S8 family peptidase [Bradyrhizobium sp. INPA03-11B]|uniref:S8 family peptidase n=1 Tax=Bradyrhizobium sp. INPA03-11B TaxID=418598 RepID=UPI00338F7809